MDSNRNRLVSTDILGMFVFFIRAYIIASLRHMQAQLSILLLRHQERKDPDRHLQLPPAYFNHNISNYSSSVITVSIPHFLYAISAALQGDRQTGRYWWEIRRRGDHVFLLW